MEQMRLVSQAPSRLERQHRFVDARSVGDARGAQREGRHRRSGREPIAGSRRALHAEFCSGMAGAGMPAVLKQPLQHVGIVLAALGLEIGRQRAQTGDLSRVALLPDSKLGSDRLCSR